jgi:hypothetical protein
VIYSEERFLQLRRDAIEERRRSPRRGYSQEMLERLAELGRAVEAGEVDPAIMAKAARGSALLEAYRDKPRSS